MRTKILAGLPLHVAGNVVPDKTFVAVPDENCPHAAEKNARTVPNWTNLRVRNLDIHLRSVGAGSDEQFRKMSAIRESLMNVHVSG